MQIRDDDSLVRPRLTAKSVADARHVTLLALVTVMSLQVARVLFVLVSDLGERRGATSDALLAGVLAVVLFLAPLLAPLVARGIGTRAALTAALVGLAGLRLAIQLVHPIRLVLASAATVTALIGITLLFVASEHRGNAAGRLRFVLGVLVGLTLDTALRTFDRTWDAAWHLTLATTVTAVLIGAGAVALLLMGARQWLGGSGEPSRARALPVAALGPFLMLQLLFLQSPAFVASATDLPLMTASGVVLVGDAFALAAVAVVGERGVSRPVRAAAAIAAVALTYLLTQLEGVEVVAVIVATQGASALLLTSAVLTADTPHQTSMWRTSSAFALAGASMVLLVFLYQVHYRVPLPFSNALVPPLAALLIAVGGVGFGRSVAGRQLLGQRALVGIPIVLLLVPLWFVAPDTPTGLRAGRTLRLLSYNVHLGVNPAGQLNPEGIARAIELEDPDVVALQEVGRGWVIGGTMDLAEWLSHRLQMPYAFAPAADGQFGNVVLSRFPILRSNGVFLPQIEGAQRRSYVEVEIGIGSGLSVTVIDTHLEGDDPDQAAQVERVLAAWGGDPRTLIVGDMNMQPDDPIRSRFEEIGLISVQDASGQGDESTAAEPKFPGDRVDWIFGTDDLSFKGFRIVRTFSFRNFAFVETAASDHLPLAVTVVVV
jgi:endonuclease/exonuclease/phosphatase family metal-dependent hydrolase